MPAAADIVTAAAQALYDHHRSMAEPAELGPWETLPLHLQQTYRQDVVVVLDVAMPMKVEPGAPAQVPVPDPRRRDRTGW